MDVVPACAQVYAMVQPRRDWVGRVVMQLDPKFRIKS